MGEMARREHPRFPIRLAVRYPSARSLLGDYTRSVSKGGVAIESGRNLEIGTEFVFAMSSPEIVDSVEIHGKVVWTRPAAQPGKFVLGIQYTFADADRRERLERLIETILGEHRYERQRRHPRVPVTIEVHGAGRVWIMRDLSLGGTMLQSSTPETLAIGAGQRLRLQVRVEQFDVVIDGEAVWIAQPFPGNEGEVVAGRFGMRFQDLEPELAEIINQIMRAQLMPARVTLTLKP